MHMKCENSESASCRKGHIINDLYADWKEGEFDISKISSTPGRKQGGAHEINSQHKYLLNSVDTMSDSDQLEDTGSLILVLHGQNLDNMISISLLFVFAWSSFQVTAFMHTGCCMLSIFNLTGVWMQVFNLITQQARFMNCNAAAVMAVTKVLLKISRLIALVGKLALITICECFLRADFHII